MQKARLKQNDLIWHNQPHPFGLQHVYCAANIEFVCARAFVCFRLHEIIIIYIASNSSNYGFMRISDPSIHDNVWLSIDSLPTLSRALFLSLSLTLSVSLRLLLSITAAPEIWESSQNKMLNEINGRRTALMKTASHEQSLSAPFALLFWWK